VIATKNGPTYVMSPSGKMLAMLDTAAAEGGTALTFSEDGQLLFRSTHPHMNREGEIDPDIGFVLVELFQLPDGVEK
jgi:hypothetical protein